MNGCGESGNLGFRLPANCLAVYPSNSASRSKVPTILRQDPGVKGAARATRQPIATPPVTAPFLAADTAGAWHGRCHQREADRIYLMVDGAIPALRQLVTSPSVRRL
jgi:hypothetical protein